MMEIERADAIRGKTLRWNWTEGPTRGESYEHRFDQDGTVTWRSVGAEDAEKTAKAPSAPAQERADYAALHVADQIYLVSYLAPSGFTLTVSVNFGDRSLVGFASNDKSWFPLRGTVDAVG